MALEVQWHGKKKIKHTKCCHLNVQEDRWAPTLVSWFAFWSTTGHKTILVGLLSSKRLHGISAWVSPAPPADLTCS